MRMNDNMILDLFKDEDKNKKLLHDIHLKLIPVKIIHNIFKINFKYKTIRGNKKENYKYVVATNDVDAKINFINYINDFNKNNQHRLLLNVKILNVSYVGQLEQLY